jgi:hypothetical protein
VLVVRIDLGGLEFASRHLLGEEDVEFVERTAFRLR